MIKISIIVPVYNTEKYLGVCLDSLISQTYKDIEIICVDDGSTDNSLQILNDYAAKDSRIKILTQKNQGPSVARNLGLEKAKGEYITFVDSDDWVSIDMCEKIYSKAIDTNADLVLFPHSRVTNTNISLDDRLQKLQHSVSSNIFYFED